MFEPRQIAPEDRLSKKQRWVVLAMNLLLLAELTLSMYWGQQDPENMSVIFLKTFVPSVVVTLVATRLLMRRFQDRVAE
ncbi:MAG: hypothetical protein WAU91_11285 [Desulfatitalea sp.]